jgi:hypothetical protein
MSLGETMRTAVFLVLLVSGCAAQGGYGGYDEGFAQSSSYSPPRYDYGSMAPPNAPGPNPTNFGTPYYVSAPPRGACPTLHIAAPC